MWTEMLSKWLGEMIMRLLMWMLVVVIGVAAISGSIVYVCMK